MRADRNAPTRSVGIAIASLLTILATTLMGAGAASAATEQGTTPTATSGPMVVDARTGTLPAGWRQDMLRRVNGVRAAQGLHPLRMCASLRRSAQGYAALMAATNTFGHLGPDGTWPWDRARKQGFSLRAVAENLALGQGSIEQVMREWVASPDHYGNLLDPRMERVGFGFAADPASASRTYWVQDFGRGTGC